MLPCEFRRPTGGEAWSHLAHVAADKRERVMRTEGSDWCLSVSGTPEREDQIRPAGGDQERGRGEGAGLPQAEAEGECSDGHSFGGTPRMLGPVLSPFSSQYSWEGGPLSTPNLQRGCSGSARQSCEGQRPGGRAGRLLPGNPSWQGEAGGNRGDLHGDLGTQEVSRALVRAEPPSTSPKDTPVHIPVGGAWAKRVLPLTCCVTSGKPLFLASPRCPSLSHVPLESPPHRRLSGSK